MKRLIGFIAVLALISMACGFNVSLPKIPTPGPEIKEEIKVPASGSDEMRLNLAFGAGTMKLSPGAEDLVNGTATYNYQAFKPVIETKGKDATIKMLNPTDLGFASMDKLKNEWDLKLGASPMNLTIDAGAYDADFEFGGLSLTGLTVKDGASHVKLAFSEPNKSNLAVFRYETGASNVKMSWLSNANFTMLDFSSGAGDYTLDFSGDLQKPASAKIESGVSNIILIIPENLNAEVTIEGGVSNINAGPGWGQNGDVYTQKGDSPKLSIVVEIGAGNVTLAK